MSELVFDCVEAKPDPYAAAPTMVFRIRISETSGESVHAIALRCQIPDRASAPPLYLERGVIAERSVRGALPLGRHPEALQLRFRRTDDPGWDAEIELVACTYDFEVTSAKYFHALEDGEIPVILLFSGSIFAKGRNGFLRGPGSVEQRGPLPSSGRDLGRDDEPLLSQ